MASPLSLGDCLAIAKVLTKAFEAAKDSSQDYERAVKLRGDLGRMRNDLQTLETSTPKLPNIPTETAQSIQQAIEECIAAVTDFEGFMKDETDAKHSIGRWWKRFMWSLVKKTDTAQFHGRLQVCVTKLGMMQHDLTRFTVVDETSKLGVKMEVMTQEVKLEISRGLDDIWIQNSIKFQDAKGDRYVLPVHRYSTFERFVAFIQSCFEDDPAALALVSRKHFWLFMPPRVYTDFSYLLTENDWTAIAYPGVNLVMSLYLQVDRPGNDKPVVETEILSESGVSFVKPLPAWVGLPETLEFRWRSQKPTSGPLGTSTCDSGISSLGAESSSSCAACSPVDIERLQHQNLFCRKHSCLPVDIERLQHQSLFCHAHENFAPRLMHAHDKLEASEGSEKPHGLRQRRRDPRDEKATVRAGNPILSRKWQQGVGGGKRR